MKKENSLQNFKHNSIVESYRCIKCNKLLGRGQVVELEIKCSRCAHMNQFNQFNPLK